MNNQLYQICNFYCRFPAMIADEEELEKICRECPLQDIPVKADEVASCFSNQKECASDPIDTDRARFVENTGWLLSQTRNGVKDIRTEDGKEAVITFSNGWEKKVSIELCSYTAIVKTLAKAIV